MEAYSRTKFDETVQLLVALSEYADQIITVDEVRDIVTCSKTDELKEYMRDIGVTITQTPDGHSLHISMINRDTGWVRVKATAFFTHMLSRI